MHQESGERRVKTLNELANERLELLAEANVKAFGRSIRPIYRISDTDTPHQFGTGLLVEIGTVRYLVTAAHVANKATTSRLSIGGSDKEVDLVGTVLKAKATGVPGSVDRIDLAWMALSSELIEEMGDVHFVPESELSFEAPPPLRLGLALGYPNSKNKRLDTVALTITPSIARYSDSVFADTAIFDKLGIKGADHLLLRFDRENAIVSSTGERITAFHPLGISGGALIDNGVPSDIRDYATDEVRPGKLVGLLTEVHESMKCILALRFSFIVRCIKTYGTASGA